MNYQELLKEENETVEDRLALAWERIHTIPNEESVPSPFREYFQSVAVYLLQFQSQLGFDYRNYTLEELQRMNQAIYGDIRPEQYNTSYGNPEYAVQTLGETYGALLSFLYSELRGVVIYVREYRLVELTCFLELFIEVYNLFEEYEDLKPAQVQKALYYFYYDYCDVLVPLRVREMYDPAMNLCTRVIEESELQDMRYLYAYGEYVSENELRIAEFLNQLPQEEIDSLAFTYTDGYREGFEIAGIDLSKKKYVNIHYAMGQERIVRAAIKQFRALGLEPIIYCPGVSRINIKNRRNGVFGTSPNHQYEYDHRLDEGIYLDRNFMERKLEVLAQAYEQNKEFMNLYAGPAVIETFGETPFEPK
ncbi:MAG: leucyl aminopeptidase, partial [Lachnospiraceae bacterium]|nr:leucyl aminopeptidase [Lachnospiraceae bacterium]